MEEGETTLMLKLDRGLRWDHDVPDDLLGLVDNEASSTRNFLHAECFETYEALKDAIADEDGFTMVVQKDTWMREVGPCAKCGALPDEPAKEPVA
jgi:hypothetical protein